MAGRKPLIEGTSINNRRTRKKENKKEVVTSARSQVKMIHLGAYLVLKKRSNIGDIGLIKGLITYSQ
jgi:hypothetical protein